MCAEVILLVALLAGPADLLAAAEKKVESGDHAGAIELYDEAIKKKPWRAPPYVGRALVWIANGYRGRAMADLDRAVKLDPKHARARAIRADLHVMADRPREAIEDYDIVLRAAPTAGAYMGRGEARLRVRDVVGAVADFTEALALRPKSSWCFLRRGRAYELMGRYEDAAKQYAQAAAAAPNEHEGHRYFALAQQKLGRHDKALEAFEAAFFTAGKAPRLVVARARSKRALGDAKGAEADIVAGAETFADVPAFFEERGRYRFDEGRTKNAIADLARAKDDYSQLYLCIARLRAGKPGREALRGYLDARAEKKDWFVRLAWFLTGRLSEVELFAVAKDKNAVIQREHECEAYFYAGCVRLVAGDKETASTYFDRAVETDLRAFPEHRSAAALR